MSAAESAMPGGQPSTTPPYAGPWLSPNDVTQYSLPIVLPDMNAARFESRSSLASAYHGDRGSRPAERPWWTDDASAPRSGAQERRARPRRAEGAWPARSAAKPLAALHAVRVGSQRAPLISLPRVTAQHLYPLLQAFGRREFGGDRRCSDERDLAEEAAPERSGHRRPALPTEEAAPEAAQGHRHDRHWRFFEDALDAGAEGLDVAGGRQPALGKDADELTVAQRLRDLGERAFHHLRILLARGDRDRAAGAEDEAEHRQLEEVVVHHESDWSATRRHDDDRVDEAHVVAYDHRRPFLRDVLEARLVDAVHRVDEQPREEPHEELGDQPVDERRNRGVEERGEQEELRHRRAEMQEHGAHQGSGHDEGRVQDVVAGDDS